MRDENLDWQQITTSLDENGFALTGSLLGKKECRSLTRAYTDEHLYRSTIRMARYNFGQGEYKYYACPLPGRVAELRESVYPYLVPLANDWMLKMGRDRIYPVSHADYLQHCHERGQQRPTPLILKYEVGDYNCLHQDLYGEEVFPIQLAILLDEPGDDFEGGEFVLTEQRPRMQSRARVIPLQQGHGVLFAVNERPVKGARGHYRVKMRHGVSDVRSGQRHTLGIIFHDAT